MIRDCGTLITMWVLTDRLYRSPSERVVSRDYFVHLSVRFACLACVAKLQRLITDTYRCLHRNLYYYDSSLLSQEGVVMARVSKYGVQEKAYGHFSDYLSESIYLKELVISLEAVKRTI